MGKFILRWAINAVALYLAIKIVPGIHMQSASWVSIIWLALIFGVINAFLGPLLKVLTCLFNILTFGLFTLIINTLLFYLAGVVASAFNVGFTVDGFWPAFLGSLVVTIVSVVLSVALKEGRRSQK